jgi:hypothetical protein
MLLVTGSIGDLTRLIQAALGPVVLISGVGLLILSMTNRLGRIIDRGRVLIARLETASGAEREAARAQLDILARQARHARRGVSLAVASLLFVALLIPIIFLSPILHVNLVHPAAALFVASTVCLVGSLASLLGEVNLSLGAHELDIRRVRER